MIKTPIRITQTGLLILLSLFFYRLHAQCELSIKSVAFHIPCIANAAGEYIPSTSKWVRICEDGGYFLPPQTTNPPTNTPNEISRDSWTVAWQTSDTWTQRKPVAIVSGSIPRIDANFGCPASGTPVCESVPWVRGVWLTNQGTEIILLKSKKLTNDLVYTTELVDLSFLSYFPQGTIRYIENFQIRWEYSSSEHGPWENAGTSENPLYITHKEPTTSRGQEGVGRFYTSLHIGCKYGDGLSSPTDIVPNIYTAFTDQCVARVNTNESECLSYWGDFSSDDGEYYSTGSFETCRKLWYLLTYGDARCNEWADFWGDILSIQGITDKDSPNTNTTLYNGEQVVVYPYNTNSIYTGPPAILLNTVENYFGPLFNQNAPFSNSSPVHLIKNIGSPYGTLMVKNWQFDQGEGYIYSLDEYGTNENSPYAQALPPYNKIYGSNITGKAAQGNYNPIKYFKDHVIYKYNNNYYDPSYGSNIFGSKDEFILGSFDGVGVPIIKIGPDGDTKLYFWLDKKMNASSVSSIYITN